MLKEWPGVGTSRDFIRSLTVSDPPSHVSSANHHSYRKSPSKGPNLDHHWIIHRSAESYCSPSLKRQRSQKDIDGGEEEPRQRKKRRLRLSLITSRLSRPYASPATHINSTKASRVGPWARQRFAGGKLLRKAAILNWVGMKQGKVGSLGAKASEWRPSDRAPRLHDDSFIARSPSTAFTAPPTQCDYDVFDYEEDDDAEEEGEEEEAAEGADEDDNTIHSDFRLLESSDTDPEFYDTSWSFIGTEISGVNTSKTEIGLVMENERKDEVSVAPNRFSSCSR